MKIPALVEEDETAVRSILKEWRDPQSVSNLLFHAALIPADIRLSTLFRGLGEREVVYYVLAAAVGFQDVDPSGLTDEDRDRVLTELLAVITITTGIIAKRASMSLHLFARRDDAPQVFALMGHEDDTVRHNLRAWLFQQFKESGVDDLNAAGRRSGVSEEVRRQVVQEFSDFLSGPPREFDGRLVPLLGYIPNLRDVAKRA